jgi:hypothetical protein
MGRGKEGVFLIVIDAEKKFLKTIIMMNAFLLVIKAKIIMPVA